MKKTLWKTLALVLALVMMLGMFAGCSSSSDADETEETETEEVEETTEETAEEAEVEETEEAEAEEETAAATDFSSITGSLTMGTGGESGTYYAFGGVLSNYIGQNTGLSINTVSTGGTTANIEGISEFLYDLALVQSDVMTYAYEGTNSFEETGANTDFLVLGALYAETVQIVTLDPEITSVSDLAGKSVCVGDVGSGTYYNTVDILAAYGMTLDDITPIYQSFGDSTESLKDGKIDAAFICAGAPTTAVTDLATSQTVYLVSIDDEHMATLLESCPYYASLTIPAGTYAGFDEDCVTITVKATLVCRADLDEDTAYAIVATIFDNAEAITELHAKGAELDLTFATEGIAVPFASGAAKYFAEHGIEVETVD
ncbi:MAG: TAXI family TRAP transporter solute-binding subunit [Oscillospiraceae bacterium]|nr:TAXI family TRAP transporter solute-binding subunit [Oscillospiraceae bacterium]